ncbi:hydroxyacid dehydrogenase [Paenibacillus albiflavus]|uniref:Hydroxyacid dehydrogenase n=1 Tax=Paenibacillus albiflavus TaxID=2545760 RepID=A0A4R4E9B1_9BACL|nr:hydroxyacid dehydrogenase [Paenibacillus albiflavus]TCZ74681.1 hydroxyacid dehydrogenase [Paenibacillus albiflavus]
MSKLRILVAIPKGNIFSTFFSDDLIRQLEEVGEVCWNEQDTHYTSEQYGEKLKDMDVVITGWGVPVLDEDVLQNANKLRLVAHTGGSVKPYISDAVYEKGIRVVSGNEVFAESVAESVIAYALASLRDIPRYSSELKQGKWPTGFYNEGLLDKTIGIVGYGMISKFVVQMLKVFHAKIKVYSGHISQEELDKHGMEKASLEDIFSTCDIVSIHSAMTPANYHLITEDLLNRMREGALLINTARGAIIDEEALCRVLASRNIRAVLDVYKVEPLPAGHPLMDLDNALLMPHMGGPTIDRRLIVTQSLIDNIHRFIEGRELKCEIDSFYASKMTR